LIDHREERKMMTMASKYDNKRKYAVDGSKDEAEEAPPKKQKTVGGDDHGDDGDDDNGNDNDDSSSSSSTDENYLSELRSLWRRK
jgi:hypothetical protein